ncbi:MAG: NAD(P)/FAD-dependent oxidoreductase, partial [Bacillota bacterium]|nr:NAD(P)/FAD-dependent oxidoreductase [Bacillota bacterium]
LNVLVLEKCHDICGGATKAGGGMIHAGFDPTPGSNKAKYNVEGNRLMYEACEELEVPYRKNGTAIFATDENSMKELYKLEESAKANKVSVEIIEPPKLYEFQPNIGKEVKAMLWAPDGGETDPFELTYALGENAASNGVEFIKDAEVVSLKTEGDGFAVEARINSGNNREAEQVAFVARIVINCAGGRADVINNMVSADRFKIIPRYGAHVVIDRKLAGGLNMTVMETPHDLPGGGHTKGMAAIPTIGGTLILGCDATEMKDPDHRAVPRKSLNEVLDYFEKNWKHFPIEDLSASDGKRFPKEAIISMFGGCRPHCDRNDFIVGEASDVPGFINASGIESPGFTASIAIAKDVTSIAVGKLGVEPKAEFNPRRKRFKPFREMDDEERRQAIFENPDYAKVVCRCEVVTEAEIRDAIRRPLGARSVSEVKMRTRAGMGRCQGGFCSTRIVEILAEELGIDLLEVTQCGGESEILTARIGDKFRKENRL